ncbi:ccr4 associated factor [Cryptotrichosporon argae]
MCASRSIASSSSAAAAARALASAPPTFAPLDRAVLELAGPDAAKFLRGLACKDVDALRGGYSGFINASGRVLHAVFIHTPRPDTYLITSHAQHPAPLQPLLQPFKLRSKLRIREASAEYDAYAAWGGEPGKGPVGRWRFGSGGAAERVWEWEGEVRSLGLEESEAGSWDLRAGWTGARQVLVPKGKQPSLARDHDAAAASEYDLRRLLAGVPEGPDEILPGQALPLESSMDLHGGVDFRKGCYLGQELTVRTYHTGATRKRILPLRLFPLSDPSASLSSLLSAPASLTPAAAGADITFHPPSSSASQKPKAAGKVLRVLQSRVGLGLVRVEMAERSWWAPGGVADAEELEGTSGLTVGRWLEGERGILTAQVGGEEFGVWVGKGEAYAAALEQVTKEAA